MMDCLIRLQIALLGLGVASTLALPVKADSAKTKVAEAGSIRAEISWQTAQKDGYAQYDRVQLQIRRDGKTLLDAPVNRESEYDIPLIALAGPELNEAQEFQVVDLDRDREPEVIVNLFTGGAHCCTYSLIYRYDADTQGYVSQRFDWQHSGYSLVDLDKDGVPEFQTVDNRFAYRFASFAASGMPALIYQYQAGELVDVTRRFPKVIYSNATQMWSFFEDARKGDGEMKGALAAYVADKCLLGQGRDGWQRVQQAYRMDDRQAFFSDLKTFLQESGYDCR